MSRKAYIAIASRQSGAIEIQALRTIFKECIELRNDFRGTNFLFARSVMARLDLRGFTVLINAATI